MGGIGLPLFRTVLLWIVCCNVFLKDSFFFFFLREVTNSGRLFGLFSLLEIVCSLCFFVKDFFVKNLLLSNSS